jgi:hypothetical protein
LASTPSVPSQAAKEALAVVPDAGNASVTLATTGRVAPVGPATSTVRVASFVPSPTLPSGTGELDTSAVVTFTYRTVTSANGYRNPESRWG